MNNKLVSFLLLCFITTNFYGQGFKATLDFKTFLNNEVAESSGLLYIDGTLWTFNDSGGLPELYAIDTADGSLIRKVRITNASNTDWEAITCDRNYIYIGDVGNNNGKRNYLIIYRINRKQVQAKETTAVKADSILFKYSGQSRNRTILQRSVYDCEAMFCIHDSVFIINKNWTNQSLAIIYAMPVRPGNYTLDPYMYFISDGLICDAAVNTDNSILAMIGYNDFLPFMSLYHIKSDTRMVLNKMYDTEFPRYHGMQTEGIVFVNKKRMFVSCEKNMFFPNALFEVER